MDVSFSQQENIHGPPVDLLYVCNERLTIPRKYFSPKKQFAPAEIFTLGFRVKFKRNDHVLEWVQVGASKLFEKAKEKDQLSVFRRSDGTLLRDIKDSFLFFMVLLSEAAEHLQN